ncbi:helix-turn-helix transcriptional regulator [Streptomyces cavourensis]
MSREISGEWKEWLEAFRVLVRGSNLTQAVVAEKLGMSAGHFSQILGGRSRFLRREALERFFLVCRSDVTDDVRAHISCLYMAALSKEEKYRELYDNYQLLDRCDAALREAAKHAEGSRILSASTRRANCRSNRLRLVSQS